MAQQYQKTCNKGCGTTITMRQDPEGKWGAHNADGSRHQCGSNQAQPAKVTQQPSLPGGPVIIGGMTKEVENWFKKLVKEAVKEYMGETS